jgi:acetyltransferase-like isoleucine patch superfamily enzyme
MSFRASINLAPYGELPVAELPDKLYLANLRPSFPSPLLAEEVVVGNGVDVGAGAILLPGARVGAGAQVGASAVVTGAVAAFAVVVGIPARPA